MSATWSPPSLLGQHLPSLPSGLTGAMAQGEQGAVQGHVATQRALRFSMNPTCPACVQSDPTSSLGRGRGHRCRASTKTKPPTPVSTYCWSGKMFRAQETLPIAFRPHQTSHFLSSEAALNNRPVGGLGRRPGCWSCVALAQCMTSLSLRLPLGSLYTDNTESQRKRDRGAT